MLAQTGSTSLISMRPSVGNPKTFPVSKAFAQRVDVPCQLGGGMRSRQNIAAAFDTGVQRVILGTKAYESTDFLKEACQEFGGERIAVGIDAKDGLVAVKGWTETTSMRAADLALERSASRLRNRDLYRYCDRWYARRTELRCLDRASRIFSSATSLPAAECPVRTIFLDLRLFPACMGQS